MIWLYIALCAALALNVGLGIALVITSRKHKPQHNSCTTTISVTGGKYESLD